MREKLIELCKSACSGGKDCSVRCFECVADHLISHGVILDKDESKISSKWIPVSERMPNENVRVIVRIDRTIWNTTFELDADRRCNGEWVRWGRAVTHWREMPAPPKGE